MGLDVYLYKCRDYINRHSIEEDYENEQYKIWSETVGSRQFEDLTETERAAASKKVEELRSRLGLDEYGELPDKEHIEEASKKYPDHLFRVGYFRSSYNSGGINAVFRKLGIPDLYDIFISEGQESYHIIPDWEKALATVNSAIGMLELTMQSEFSLYDVTYFGWNVLANPEDEAFPKNEQKALEIFEKEYIKHKDSRLRPAYSNYLGKWFFDGLEIFAVIPGIGPFGDRGIYVAFKPKVEDGEHRLTWYKQALEIVKETIEYVISQPDRDDYFLGWSS